VPLHTALANDGVPLFFDDDDDDDDAEASSSGGREVGTRGTLAWKRATTLRTTLLVARTDVDRRRRTQRVSSASVVKRRRLTRSALSTFFFALFSPENR
jgi:hypothetical protein